MKPDVTYVNPNFEGIKVVRKEPKHNDGGDVPDISTSLLTTFPVDCERDIQPFVYYDPRLSDHSESCFTPEQIQEIISYSEKSEPQFARVGGSDDDVGGVVNLDIRKVDTWLIPLDAESSWIYHQLNDACYFSNRKFWNFDIRGIGECIQLLRYRKVDNPGLPTYHYDAHVDADRFSTRKLTCIVQLNGDDDYDGGEIILYDQVDGKSMPKDSGSMILFPSYTLHEVKPITDGERWSIVTWFHGPQWR